MDYLTTKECADKLGFSRVRVLELIKAQRIPAVKVGRDWLVLSKDLEEFIKLPRSEGWPKGRPRKFLPKGGN